MISDRGGRDGMASEPDTGAIERIMRESGRRVREDHAFTVSTKGTRENLVTSADVENERFLKSELTSSCRVRRS